jgi:hypothetical protein
MKIFKFIFSAGISSGSPRPLEAYVPVSKCSLKLSSLMSDLTYPAKHLLSSSCGPPRPARAVLPWMCSPQSSSIGPLRPSRAPAHRDVLTPPASAQEGHGGPLELLIGMPFWGAPL